MEIDDHLLCSFIYPHLDFTFQEAETLASSHLSKGPKAAENPHGKKCGPGIYVEQFFSKSYLFPLSPQYLKLLCIHYQQHVE